MEKPILHAALALAFLSTATTAAAGVMPFNLAATQPLFTKTTADGGAQRVVARKAADADRVRLVAALHARFDAQVSDHGRDAQAGHSGAHGQHHR